MSLYPIDDVNFCHFIKVVAARFLHFKVRCFCPL